MDEIAKRMSELAERFGPNVIDAARGAAQMEAYSSMMSGAVCLVACAGFARLGYYLWSKRDDADDMDGYGITAVLAWVVAVILIFPGVWSFIDPWVWATINNPDLWIAKKVLRL